MSDDWTYLRRFRDSGDQEAFAEIVRRYIDLVWATARRVGCDADLARDVSQNVFSDLARKADRIPKETILVGWLHRAASFAACRAVRDQSRRRFRERLAMELQSLERGPDPEESTVELLPMLDEAIAALQQKDRDAILLRYFGRKNLAEIGVELGVSEDAAQKRIARALDRLRSHFRRRGLEASTGLIAAALGTAAAQAAPAGIAIAIAGSISAAGAAGATLAGQWLAHVSSSITLMKTPIMTAALVAATVSVPLIYQEHQRSQLMAANGLFESQAAELPYWREVHARSQAQEQLSRELAQLRRGHDELMKLQAEAAALATHDFEQKLEWQRRLEAAQALLAAARTAGGEIEEKIQAQELSLKRVNDLKQLGLAARIWATDNGDKLPPTFRDITNELPSGVSFEEFTAPYEYVQHARPIRETEPNLILFREKEPRRLPDGRWARAYTFADGSVQQQVSDTGDFSEWERNHMAQPMEPQPGSSAK